MILAIIPARSGSKRIPGKNIRLLGGRPIMAYPIQAALKTGLFDRVIVSTDSEEIAEIARDAGAEVPFLRPKNLADDQTPTADVLLHALQWLKTNGLSVKYLCCLYPTAAFVRTEDLIKGLQLIREGRRNAALSVTTFDFPVFRAFRLTKDGRVEMVWPEHEFTRSNDLPELYHDAGQFYWLEAESFLERRTLFSSKSVPVILSRHRTIDIDTEEDWMIAERLWSLTHMNNPAMEK